MKENNENIERYSTQAKELLNLKIITKDEYEERIQDYTDYTNSEGNIHENNSIILILIVFNRFIIYMPI